VRARDRGAIRTGENFDAKKLVAALEKHQCAPKKADDVLAAALQQAKESERRVLLAFGAPW
jgi:hypothetical protein